jgi:hypothetical protein
MRQALEARLVALGTQLLTVEFEAECVIALIQPCGGSLAQQGREPRLDARRLGHAADLR